MSHVLSRCLVTLALNMFTQGIDPEADTCAVMSAATMLDVTKAR